MCIQIFSFYIVYVGILAVSVQIKTTQPLPFLLILDKFGSVKLNAEQIMNKQDSGHELSTFYADSF